jgi:hypothetical protein
LNPNQAEPVLILDQAKKSKNPNKEAIKTPILQLNRLNQKSYPSSVTPQSDLNKSHSREMIERKDQDYQFLRNKKIKDDHSLIVGEIAPGNPPSYPLRHVNTQRSVESGSQRS